jgi:hypothetical protein
MGNGEGDGEKIAIIVDGADVDEADADGAGVDGAGVAAYQKQAITVLGIRSFTLKKYKNNLLIIFMFIVLFPF